MKCEMSDGISYQGILTFPFLCKDIRSFTIFCKHGEKVSSLISYVSSLRTDNIARCYVFWGKFC